MFLISLANDTFPLLHWLGWILFTCVILLIAAESGWKQGVFTCVLTGVVCLPSVL